MSLPASAAGWPILKQIGSPIMGIAILIGLAILARRLWASNLRTATAA